MSKTQALVTTPKQQEPIRLSDQNILPAMQVRILGQCLSVKVPSAGTWIFRERMRVFLQRLARIQTLGVPIHFRQKLAQVLAMAKLDFSPWQIAPTNIPSVCRSAVVKALLPALPDHRSPEVVLMAFFLMHTIDPLLTLLYRLICAVRRNLAEAPKPLCSFPVLPLKLGPMTALVEALATFGIEVTSDATAQDEQGRYLSLLEPTSLEHKNLWRHQWRTWIRNKMCQQLADRRSDFAEISGGIDI